MRVRATKPAFYEATLVQPGTELDVPDDLVGNWFVPTAEVKAKPEPKKGKPEPKALSELAKESAPQSFNDVMAKKADDIA